MPTAITRALSSSITNCELTHLERTPIDLELARIQHRQYESALKAIGCDVISLPELQDLPDSVFVEDAAVIFDEVAIITNPGVNSRTPEIESIANVLGEFRELIHIKAPATVDGGDVLVVEKTVYVGTGGRTNRAAIEQMQQHLRAFGYTVIGVEITGCLHLKSAVTAVSPNTLLINSKWVGGDNFEGLNFIEVDGDEPFAANGLLIGETVIYPTEFPKTRKKLEDGGINLKLVNAGELAKAEGAVTCCSLILN